MAAEEGETERENCPKECNSSLSDLLLWFMETLLLGVGWLFGDDMVGEGGQSPSAGQPKLVDGLLHNGRRRVCDETKQNKGCALKLEK